MNRLDHGDSAVLSHRSRGVGKPFKPEDAVEVNGAGRM